MQYPNDIDSLWALWESNVLEHGFEADETQSLCRHIEKVEKTLCPSEASDEEAPNGLAMAHKMFDQLYAKKCNKHINLSHPAKRVILTRFGAIYENGVSVRGIERLMRALKVDNAALRLKDGFYHVNHLPGVQPTASEHVNARNKNVERVDIDVVETFINACQETGMEKRGWKKAVNQKFDISRQEFTKWLLRYFPCYDLPIPIERKTSL
jgi:hypothetical protein